MVFEKKMSVKDLIEQMREELKKEQDEVSPRRNIKKMKKKPVTKKAKQKSSLNKKVKKTKTVKKKK